MLRRLTHGAPAMSCVGVFALVIGLAWDARLHHLNPQLAETEGILTLANPGHALFAAGLGLCVVGATLYLLGQMLERADQSWFWRGAFGAGAAGLVALSLVGFASAAQTGGALVGGHVHQGVATATSGAGHSHGAVDLSTVTPEQRAAADKLVQETKAGTARFADFAVAQAEGYVQVSPYPVGDPKNGYGPAHFYNGAYAKTGNYLDPTHPPSLVYLKTADGRMILLGAMFLAPNGKGPTPGGALTQWHSHANLCFDPANRLVTASGTPERCARGTRALGKSQDMLHVWTFDNPDGPFVTQLSRAAIVAALKQGKSS